MNESLKFPKISFKGVFVFMLIVGIGILLLTKPFVWLGIAKQWSFYLACSISSTVGMSLVILWIDDKVRNASIIIKRIVLSIIVCFGLSFLLVFYI